MRRRLFAALLLGPALTAWAMSLLGGASFGIAVLIALGVLLISGVVQLLIDRSLARDARLLAGHAQATLGREPRGADPENPALQELAVALLRTRQRDREGSRALSDEARALAAVLDGMEEGLWVTDRMGNVIRHNAALARMLPPGQAIDGERPLAIVRSAELADAVQRACSLGATSRLEITLEEGLLGITVSPLGGGLEGSSAIFHDVTELRRLEKVRKDFVANVSHELRTPITAVRGYAETLQAGALQDPVQASRMVEIIHRQSIRLAEMVEDLLELSRLEGKETHLVREPVPLGETVRRATETVQPKAEAKGVTLALQVPEGLMATADDRGLEMVVQNLLDNAVKYTAPGGRVEVLAEERAGRCAVVIRDTGVGIEGRHLGRVFERFYRVDPGRSRDMGGTGLGLAIVKHLVGGMGGEMQVESQPGVGSTFTVLLPLHRQTVPTG